jgi:hypothetical protein
LPRYSLHVQSMAKQSSPWEFLFGENVHDVAPHSIRETKRLEVHPKPNVQAERKVSVTNAIYPHLCSRGGEWVGLDQAVIFHTT